MSLTHRKRRPLRRDKADFRDDHFILIASDDKYAPQQYFESLQLRGIKFFVEPASDTESSAERVLQRLLRYDHEPDDERWLVLDTDHRDQGPHLRGFISTLKEAEDKGINIALSKPCFEVWLLLHQADEESAAGLMKCGEIIDRLKAVPDGYNKTNIRPERFVEHMPLACERARRLDESVSGGLIPASNTTRVYKIFDALKWPPA